MLPRGRRWLPSTASQDRSRSCESHQPCTILLLEPEHFHRRRLRITVEDRVDMLHDVSAHVEEVPLVLNRDRSQIGW